MVLTLTAEVSNSYNIYLTLHNNYVLCYVCYYFSYPLNSSLIWYMCTITFSLVFCRRSIDITATLLTEVCHNVTTEPTLQPLSGENFDARSTNTSDGARVDIRARGFWNASQDAFFDVRVFYPNAPSNRSTLTSSAYRRHEQAKKREYGQRIREVEHGVFTPLVFSSTGGMGQEATTFYKRLASMISQKRQHPYPTVTGWLRCRLSFAALRSAIMCIRGSRSSFHRPIRGGDVDITLATSEGRIPT